VLYDVVSKLFRFQFSLYYYTIIH